MYNATLFCNTGFNAVNIPDSPATLNLAQAQYTVPALDIYQARELSRFVVRANYGVVKNADYLYLVNSEDSTDFAFYSVQNVTMTSKDTAVLDVTMDYILTAGGVSNLTFLDGMCERHHVSPNDDDFGAYDEEDPYLTPAEMLKIDTTSDTWSREFRKDGTDTISDEDVVIIESTIDLFAMYGDAKLDFNLGALYTDPSGETVTVPQVRPAYANSGSGGSSVDYTTAEMPAEGIPSDYKTYMPQVKMFVANKVVDPQGTWPELQPWGSGNIDLTGWVGEALARVRSLGVESCIIAQYAIPYFMIYGTAQDAWTGYVGPGTPSDPRGTHSTAVCGYIGTIKGRPARVDTELPYEFDYLSKYGYTVKNERLYYGDNCKYTIVSLASGNKASFLPEEIYVSNLTSPTVEMRVDPRPNGCPYFRFSTYRGVNDGDNPDMFFVNSVKGLQWQNVPLVYQGASGSLLNQYAYNARMAAGEEGYNASMKSIELGREELMTGALTGVTSGALSAVGYYGEGQAGRMLGSIGNIADTLVNLNYGMEKSVLSQEHQQNSWNIQKNAELQSLLIRNNVVAPSMNFPISEGIRDYVGNTCIVYRTYYTENDIKRLDKILSMYGYKHTTPITTALLTNRPKFNYIQARGVSIGNINLPKWMRDGVASQFATGTRIWHQLPDASAYTDGSNA